MKRINIAFLGIFLFVPFFSFSQVNYTANNQVPTFDDHFRYGVSPGYYPSWAKDTILANIAAGNPEIGVEGAGITVFRATLPGWFVHVFGYDIRVKAFEHYEKLGMTNHTVFLEDPDSTQLEKMEYCAGEPSLLFENMYTDIWDGGANGTPINDENYYAVYVYNTVKMYKDYVKFWEIWNEPDFTSSGNAFADPSQPGSWWSHDPDPCDLKIKTPIYNYIRMLRISYEVIKTLDPDAYITVGGIGFPSFLHAILRNTDNPNGGAVTDEYPHKGGAYFDVLSYHVYPHIDGCFRDWNNDIGGFEYFRHSDAGADCLIQNKEEHQDVLYDFGYDGSTYPEKLWILTETNLPRKTMGSNESTFGNDIIQRHWVIKAMVLAQVHDIKQVHLFKLGEDEDYDTATSEFDLMGLYKNLNAVGPYQQEYTDQGIALRTISEELSGMRVNKTETAMLNLPPTINGAAFVSPDGSRHKYVLWAKTTVDKSEVANATYSFPASLNLDMLERKTWSSSVDGSSLFVGTQNLLLSGEPMIFTPSNEVSTNEVSTAHYIQKIFPNPTPNNIHLEFALPKTQTLTIHLTNINGQNLYSEKILVPSKDYKHDIKVANLPTGLYFIKIIGEEGQHVEKVLVMGE